MAIIPDGMTPIGFFVVLFFGLVFSILCIPQVWKSVQFLLETRSAKLKVLRYFFVEAGSTGAGSYSIYSAEYEVLDGDRQGEVLRDDQGGPEERLLEEPSPDAPGNPKTGSVVNGRVHKTQPIAVKRGVFILPLFMWTVFSIFGLGCLGLLINAYF